MSLRDLCDVVYVRLIDQVEARAATERLAVVVIKAMGNGADVDIPTQDGEREQFDALLIEPPAPASTAASLLREWGLT